MTAQYATYEAPPVCEREVLRYAGVRHNPDEQTAALCRSCIEEAAGILRFTAAFARVPLTVHGEVCDFGAFCVSSPSLSRHLCGCDEAVILAATVGTELDRLILRYSRLSPARAVMLQAFGAERIEALCNTLCEDIKERAERHITSRFSPGYGDVPLEVQREIFAVLDCERRLGMTLTDSLLMSPTKSVTAFAGLTDTAVPLQKSKCSRCEKTDCVFRGGV